MNLNNIKLIFRREMRDQMRDRRTIFMIAVLPLLFYPLLGFSFFQIAQFLKENPSKVLVVGDVDMKGLPALFGANDEFAQSLFGDEKKSSQFVKVTVERLVPGPDGKLISPYTTEQLQQKIASGEFQAVFYIPPDFSEQLAKYRRQLKEQVAGRARPGAKPPEVPKPQIISDMRQEKSSHAAGRLNVVDNWTKDIGRQTLLESQLPESAAQPVSVDFRYLGTIEDRIDVSLWSKVLPFVLLIWAVTGAFYPAVDLCAGEKERGTLETLLSSPAQRSEIVMGKLLTVMVFSIVTAVLNLMSMGITGSVVMKSLGSLPMMANVGPPPLASLGWLIIVLLPVSALFSAVCLSLAAFARSTKEGQYYLMPVILVTMPLILLPMAPSVELTLGTSLVPVSGIVLLMRSIMEGTFGRLWPYSIPVAIVTLICCWVSIRWAIDQFSSESVLFREGERWDISTWFAHLRRDREATPSVAMAFLCGVMILVIKFLGGMVFPTPETFRDLLQTISVSQLAMVATPALLMAVMLTSRPGRTLLLSLPLNARSLFALPAAALLALLVHPILQTVTKGIVWLYPYSPELRELDALIVNLISQAPNMWVALFAIALLPALCEELAFRGFILSGLRHSGHKWRAIIISALFFGVAHTILQQSITAALLGCLIGYVAVQCGSLWPCVVFHFVHNLLGYFVSFVHRGDLTGTPFGWLQQKIGEEYIYRPEVVLAAMLGMLVLLVWFSQFPYRRTQEETLQESIEQDADTVHSLAG